MALIEKAKGRSEKQTLSGYTRIFGNEALGNLISRVQATSISNGTELEKMIMERAKAIPNLDEFIESDMQQFIGVWVARKQQVKKSQIIKSKKEPDFLAFDPKNRVCYIIEVKDGDQFDTKKASGEYESLKQFANDISSAISFKTKIFLCAFNAREAKEIFDGLKKAFPIEHLLTGSDLCTLLEIDYKSIIEKRIGEQEPNFEYFIAKLVEIPVVRAMISKLLGK